MIEKEMVMPLIIKVCPSFEQPWEEHLDSWEGEEAGLYNDFGEFVIHLVESYRKGDTQYFKNVFDVIELLLKDGDSYVKGATSVGFLEDLQNYSANTGVDPNEFIEFLGSETLIWWKKINKFWA
jgi:hypothetical protein